MLGEGEVSISLPSDLEDGIGSTRATPPLPPDRGGSSYVVLRTSFFVRRSSYVVSGFSRTSSALDEWDGAECLKVLISRYDAL